MGGYGSGRRWDAKATTDHALRLDVRWLARVGLIRAGRSAWMPLSWTCNGQSSGDITVSFYSHRPDQMILDYRARTAGETMWTDMREAIRLEWTPCHFGGKRVWCRCPGCGSRRAVLYSVHERFLCVACNGLAYGSTREAVLYRLNRRGERITDRLGAEREWVLTWRMPPDKPKGMRWATYDRLHREWCAIWDAANADYIVGFVRFIEQHDWMLGPGWLGPNAGDDCFSATMPTDAGRTIHGGARVLDSGDPSG